MTISMTRKQFGGAVQLGLFDEIRAKTPQMAAAGSEIVATGDPRVGTNPHHCEVEALCHSALNIMNRKHVCGWKMAGTVQHCPKRKRLNGGES